MNEVRNRIRITLCTYFSGNGDASIRLVFEKLELTLNDISEIVAALSAFCKGLVL
jgi:hypothetical protein